MAEKALSKLTVAKLKELLIERRRIPPPKATKNLLVQLLCAGSH